MASKYIPPCFRSKSSKEKNAPLALRNELVPALDKSKAKLEGTWKALEDIVGKPEYRRLGEQLLDVLYTGGLLTHEGRLATRGALKQRTNYCVFKTRDDLNALRVYEQLFVRLMRRHKHVELAFEPHARRFLTLLSAFEPDARHRLARFLTLFLVNGTLSAPALLSLGLQPGDIDEGITLQFMLDLFITLKQEKGVPYLLQVVKRAGLDNKIMSFMPPQLRSDLYFHQVFQEHDLMEIIKLHQLRAGQELRRQLRERLLDDFSEQVPYADVVKNVRQFQREHNMSDAEVIGIVWDTIITQCEWRQDREHEVTEQAIRHVQPFCSLLNIFCSTDSAQIALLMSLQEFCYENHNFLKSFEKLVVHFYRMGVVNEDSIVRWYEVDHVDQGKVAFLGQMRRFMKWLNTGPDASCRADYNSFVLGRKPVAAPKVYSDQP